ncbi:myelin protein zero-like protein 3 [Chanos chanos]|uniref:Myelin protein zero-like protein 3 n=1 Tax=Chanos chanos TaxID=29144 RepID=A0A6J2VNU4_CHACN|nr:myelin protein zero-like protein 3 [Chanos chanos]
MDLHGRWQMSSKNVVLSCLFVSFALCPVYSIKVTAPAEINAVTGETVTLSCSFTSNTRVTSKMSVDWSYRPQNGKSPVTFFHYLAKSYPPQDGQFAGRVKWLGSPSTHDASVQLLNASLHDNGTYICSVRNPPDTHGSPAQTLLTVTPKKQTTRFTDVALLLLFVLVPSAGISLVLLGQILCPCCDTKERSPNHAVRSPIEVADGEEYLYKQPNQKEKRATCCEMYCLDSDDEEYYMRHLKDEMERLDETQC